MRTLVIGIPLPHVTYDNYSFLSAPSFADYRWIIVQPLAVSALVEEVVAGARDHRTFAGQQVLNGATSSAGFGLADLLNMRRRETEWVIANGGIVVCFAYPDVTYAGVVGIDAWSRYDWLPAPDGFHYKDHLLPGFGRPGAVPAGEGHAFTPYADALAPRLAYRAVIDETAPGFEEYGRVFIRSEGGVAIGAELSLGEGRVILLPPLVDFETDRVSVAETLFECFERLSVVARDPVRGEAP